MLSVCLTWRQAEFLFWKARARARSRSFTSYQLHLQANTIHLGSLLRGLEAAALGLIKHPETMIGAEVLLKAASTWS